MAVVKAVAKKVAKKAAKKKAEPKSMGGFKIGQVVRYKYNNNTLVITNLSKNRTGRVVINQSYSSIDVVPASEELTRRFKLIKDVKLGGYEASLKETSGNKFEVHFGCTYISVEELKGLYKIVRLGGVVVIKGSLIDFDIINKVTMAIRPNGKTFDNAD